jgi:hypothetical protein
MGISIPGANNPQTGGFVSTQRDSDEHRVIVSYPLNIL